MTKPQTSPTRQRRTEREFTSMKKAINIVAVTLYLVLSLTVIISGLYMCDALPGTITDAIDDVVSPEDLPDSGSAIINNSGDNTDSATVVTSTKNKFLTEQMSGVWIDLGSELTAPESATTASLLKEIDNYIDYFTNFRTNTLFITPDIANRYAGFKDSAGNDYDLLRYFVDKSLNLSYYPILVLNDSMLYDNSGNFNTQYLTYYLGNYNFSGVCISAQNLRTGVKYAETVNYFGEYIKTNYSDRTFGIDFYASAAPYFDANDEAVLSCGYIDFATVEGTGAISGSATPFGDILTSFNNIAAKFPSIYFAGVCRADYYTGGVTGYSGSDEIKNQVQYIFDCEHINGFVLRNAYSLRKNDMMFARKLTYLLVEPTDTDMLITGVSVDSENSTVTFTGTGAANHKVYCNDKMILPSGGAFSYTYTLTAGENDIEFFCNGKTVDYTFYSNSTLLQSYSPAEDINVSKNDTITVSAVCLDGSTVTARLNSKDYILNKTTSDDSVPEGYALYTCGISFASNSYIDLNLGNIVFTAQCEGSKETATGGRVTLMKSDRSSFLNSILQFAYSTFFRDSVKAPSTLENTNETGLSPYNDNGLGTSLMCKVLTDGTEQLGTATEYDTYHPTYSTLPAGMYDYVDSITPSEKGYLRYELRSGISVYSTGIELISNAYTMPENKLVINGVDESNAASTDIVFEKDWFSPIEITTSPLAFTKGYLDYSFSLSSFDAEYIDVKFYYTSEFYNMSLLQFASNSVFSNGELYSDGSGNMILRLYLRQKGQFYGYDIYEDDNGRLVLSFKKHSDGSLTGKTVMLDAGHGGLSMTGTATSDGGTAEANVTLPIALKARDMLEKMGATVILTRDTADEALTLQDRVDILTEKNPDLFVSIHCDGTDDITSAGTHTFYYTPFSKPLAAAIHSSLVTEYQSHIYKSTDTNYSLVDRGTKYYPFYVTRMFNCPSVLVETGFLTNPVEGTNLANDNCQYWIAQGIANGIRDYFASNY